jgi:hypothetical protein
VKPAWPSLNRRSRIWKIRISTNLTHGNDPRPDDVLKVLLPTIEADQDLRDHQDDEHGKAKRFVTFFGEYIIDKNV